MYGTIGFVMNDPDQDMRMGLDEILAILAELHTRGVTIGLVTHDPGKARRARRGIEMRDGRGATESLGAARAGS